MRYPAKFNLKRHTAAAADCKSPDLAGVPDEHYDLYGVVIHSGASTSSGHYYSYCKQGTKWFECDDSHIGAATEQQALS